MAISLVNSISAGSTDAGFTATTVAEDMSGATLLVMGVISYAASSTTSPTISDSTGVNTWLPLTETLTPDGALRAQLWYVVNPTVSTTQTFTATKTLIPGFQSIGVFGLSGSDVSTPFDQENGNASNSATSLTTGSVTPGVNNEIVITVSGNFGVASGISINGGFTIQESIPLLAANHLGLDMAMLIQTSAASANPTWSWSNADEFATVIATFKASAAAAGNPWNSYAQQ